MAPSVNLDQQIRLQIGRELTRRGLSAAQVSKSMGHGRNFLGRKLRGESPLSLSELDELCEAAGLDKRRLLERSFSGLTQTSRTGVEFVSILEIPPAAYADLLERIIVQPPSAAETRHLEQIDSACSATDLPKADDSLPPPDEYAALTHQIDSHPTVGFDLAKRQISAMAPPSSPKEALASACLITAWSIASLRIGKTTLGVLLAVKALRLHGTASLSRTYPPLLRTVSTLMVGLGELPLALSVAQHAQYLSNLVEGNDGHVKSALLVASVYHFLGDLKRAKQLLSILSNVPTHLAFTVRYTLARLHFDSRDYVSAYREVAATEPVNRQEEIHANWFRARLLVAQGHLLEALPVFDELLTKSEGQLPPSDRLLVFLDMIPSLRQTGNSSVTKVFATQLLPDLEKLEINKATRRLRDDVLDAATRGILNPGIERAHRRLLVQIS